MHQDFTEQIERHFPFYLTSADKAKLLGQLREFPHNKEFYLADSSHQWLQGDGWRGFVLFDFEDEALHHGVNGIIISNSCDIDPKNGIEQGQKVVFAPIFLLDSYLSSLKEAGWNAKRLSQRRKDIVEQQISNFLYLPSPPSINHELVVRLDDINSNLLTRFRDLVEKQRLFRLSQYGFYVFLIKLSVHLTRLREGISRTA